MKFSMNVAYAHKGVSAIMETAQTVILILYGAGIAVAILLLIYLIFKRIQDKKKEKFEDRDN